MLCIVKASIGLASCTYDISDLVLRCWWSTHIGGVVKDSVYRVSKVGKCRDVYSTDRRKQREM